MTLEEFQAAIQKALDGIKAPRNIVARVEILDLHDSHIHNAIVSYDIKEINFDENSGTLYIGIR